MKAAPCLATGNVFILKPSEHSPLGSLAIAPLFEVAGFPKGVFQVLIGAGDTGSLLSNHMKIRKVSKHHHLSMEALFLIIFSFPILDKLHW